MNAYPRRVRLHAFGVEGCITLLASLEQDYAINVDADTLDVMLFETPESIASIVLDPKYHSKA
ncbi:MAG: hypothetical protein EOP09_20090 [Proteobacteria bacterium]|nr:MAG: hypothetical protein EOP09_20090 [Pseudomonadota bacterium]